MQTRIHLEPAFRIHRAGCNLTVRNVRTADGSIKHCIGLIRNSCTVASATVARNSKFGVAELEARARQGQLARSSGMYRALCELADLAEQLAQEGV